jgi:hypothetical protein
MAKIDCSVTVDFLREWRRYCGGRRCGYCDLSEHNECGFPACQVKDHPDKAVGIIQKWSDEHPQKTRLDDLLEKCPEISLNYVDKVPYIKPYHFGYCKECAVCPLRAKSSVSLTSCWNEPLVGGATGEAVE